MPSSGHSCCFEECPNGSQDDLGSSLKATLKGRWLFPCFLTCANLLPTLHILPHFCVCFQKGEGQERAELVPKGGVPGRCEGSKAIKTGSNQQPPQPSSSCLSTLPTKPALEVLLASDTKRTHVCVSNHLIFLPPSPSLGIPDH